MGPLAKRCLLMIFDGLGRQEDGPSNAVTQAHMPNFKELIENHFFTEIEASGEAVGLPKGVCGNSEVGHMNLGAGRAPRQDLVRINEAVENNSLSKQESWKKLIEESKAGSKRIHLMGLFSDGSVHSHLEHLFEIIKELRKEKGIELLFHAFTDGRDTPTENGIIYLNHLKEEFDITPASLHGRSFAMDRDQRWERVEQSYKVLTGQGLISELSPHDYLKNEYKEGRSDEFVTPALFDPSFALKQEDVIFFINFRPDRARELTQSFVDPDFSHFSNEIRPRFYLCMTPYFDPEERVLPVLFDKEPIRGGLSEYLSSLNLKQFKIAETEKYAHVTYFFNGGEEKAFTGEDRELIKSPRDVATYDLKPEMSAHEVAEHLIHALKHKEHNFYVVNFANPDMVGHTGNLEATIKALETLDQILGQIIQVCEDNETAMILTADHGNCDQMSYEDGRPHTSHTNSLVPLSIMVPGSPQPLEPLSQDIPSGSLRDVAPSVLTLLGLPIPKTFTGRALFKEISS